MHDETPQLISRFLKEPTWYHCIDFPGGERANGVYDLTAYLSHYNFPPMSGKTVLDVGCSDGFFSFEFERRGAKRILAVDTNTFNGQPAISPSPAKRNEYEEKYRSRFERNEKYRILATQLGLPVVSNFQIARTVLKSNVAYLDRSIYNLHSLGESFDVVFCGDLIEHLKNPIEAVEQLCVATRELCIISVSNTAVLPWWLTPLRWVPHIRDRLVTYWGDRGGTFFHFSPEAFSKVILASGFSRTEIVSRFNMENLRNGGSVPHAVYHCWK